MLAEAATGRSAFRVLVRVGVSGAASPACAAARAERLRTTAERVRSRACQADARARAHARAAHRRLATIVHRGYGRARRRLPSAAARERHLPGPPGGHAPLLLLGG